MFGGVGASLTTSLAAAAAAQDRQPQPQQQEVRVHLVLHVRPDQPAVPAPPRRLFQGRALSLRGLSYSNVEAPLPSSPAASAAQPAVRARLTVNPLLPGGLQPERPVRLSLDVTQTKAGGKAVTYLLPETGLPTSRRRLTPALPTILSGLDGEEEDVLLPLPPAGEEPAVGVPRVTASVSDSGALSGAEHRKSLSQGISEIFDRLGLHRKTARPGASSYPFHPNFLEVPPELP